MGEGVQYETAGSLQNGRKVWLLAKLPKEYQISGEKISSYLIFSNTHDGSSAVRVAVTPIRVVCQNTLNLALQTAKRSWSMIHTGNIQGKIQEAKDTLFLAGRYMEKLEQELETLQGQELAEQQVERYIHLLLPIKEKAGRMQTKHVQKLREDLICRYYEAPDLKGMWHHAYRFINAVSDFATHCEPLRRTANYKENLFGKTVDGNPLIDRAYQLVKTA